ncbi:MAG: 6-phosphogluconolactonase [Anaerolineae bacterium]|nr:6-phosphogluconolactonase [Anaerolineae bacterium]
MTELHVFPTADALAEAAAEYMVQLAHAAVMEQGRFSVALSGGSTPRALHAHLAAEPLRSDVDWGRVHVFWGDERCVPPDHPDSNYRMARETLLDHVPIPAGQVHRMPGELPPTEAAAAYEAELRSFFGAAGEPRFDLALLGMGDDGHTASLFPGTAALAETERWVAANWVEKLNTWRLTLTVPTINQAANVVFLVAGAGKADRLREVLRGPYQPTALPSQFIRPIAGRLAWFVDMAAASGVES